MSRLERPLVGRTLRTTGDVVLRAPLVLGLKTNGGTWYDATFLVDTGTKMTTVPAFDARAWDLPVPMRPVPGLTLSGQEVRAGLLRARVVGMDPTEYVFPCYFLGDPNLPPPAPAKNLLGLSGVISQLRLSFDGTSSLRAPWGVLVIEKK
jgi:hypothetical protein